MLFSAFTYARENGIPEADTLVLAQRILAEIERQIGTMQKTVSGLDDERIRAMHHAGSLVSLMGESGNPSLLPFFESKLNSAIDPIRAQSAIAYAKIDGVGIFNFLKRRPEGRSGADGTTLRPAILSEIFKHVECAQGSNAPQSTLDYSFLVLVREAYNADNEEEADMIDAFLCRHMPNYPNSLQRQWILKPFLNSTNNAVRESFVRRYNSIQEKPMEMRDDLSRRFPFFNLKPR